jgi:PPIC-type PPIASE domain
VFRDNHGDPANEFALLLRVRQQWVAGAPAELLGRQFGRPIPPEPGRFFDFTRGQGGGDWAEMEQTLFALKPGEVSDVLRTGYGYHLLRLERVEPARSIPYDEARTSIAAHLHRERVEQTLGVKVDALRAAAILTGLPDGGAAPA